MKPAILVTSHPNSPKKEYILKDFGNFISQWGIDHYLFTNYPAEKDTQQEFKESHFLNYNPPCPLIEEGMQEWRTWFYFSKINLTFNHNFNYNWCKSGTSLMSKGINYLKSLGYTHVYVFIYDTNPDWKSINDFIQLSDKTFLESNKKAILFDFPPISHIKREGLYNHIYSGEIDFLSKIFQQGTSNYSTQNSFLHQDSVTCENYWLTMFEPYKDEIKILPSHKVIPSIVESEKFSYFPDGIQFFTGRYQDKTIFTTIKKLDNIELLDHKNNKIEFKFLHKSTKLTSIKFNSIEGESYYINGTLILEDTLNWRKSNSYSKGNLYS